MRSVGDVGDMVFGDRFDDRVPDVAWPDSVVCLEFSMMPFEQEIDGAQWPAFFAEAHIWRSFQPCVGGEERGRAL